MTGDRFTPALRLSSRATQDGKVEVRFLNWVIELEADQARELQRELTHSIGLATYGRPRADTHDRILRAVR